MSQSAARLPQPGESERPEGSWPHGLGQQPTLRVGDVLAALHHEFPSLSPSKLRFLDAQGLVCPHRASSGYRQYSAAHVERLRYVLRQQRDAYAPLSVIKERLESLDAGHAYEPVALSAVSQDDPTVALSEAAAAAGVDVGSLIALIDEGVIAMAAPGRIERDHVRLATTGARFLESGADVREVRALVRAATREVEAAERASAPLRRRDNAVAARAARQSRLEAAAALFAAVIETTDNVGE